MSKTYTREEAFQSSLDYFKGDSLAADVWVNKYSLKDTEGNIYELNPDMMHRRLAKEFARIESNYEYGMGEEEIYALLKDFKYVVPQGSPMAGIGNDYQTTSISNCFVVGDNNKTDSYGSIMRTDEEIAQIYKRRGGVGLNISHLRPIGAMANGANLKEDAGATLFMERYSNTTREVAQSGRRGACLVAISIKHPDADVFVDKKLDGKKVTGANVSVQVTDEFMNAVKCNGDFYQTFPIDLEIGNIRGFIDLPYNELRKCVGVDGKKGYIKKIKAKNLWDKIIKNSHSSAEPGCLFWDTILKESPANRYGKEWEEKATNPCFTGDTIIAVADGKNGVSIKELAEYSNGKNKFPVYSAKSIKNRNNWKTQIKNAVAFKTGFKKVLEVKLSDGSKFKCTEDHLLARPDGSYIEAYKSEGVILEKFYSFSNKNSNKSYRHINSKTNGYARQYRMIWEFHNGKYDGKSFNIDHINSDSKDDTLTNLQLLSYEDHKVKSSISKYGKKNPIFKVNKEYVRLDLKRKNILGNASRYNWSKERLNSELSKWDDENYEYMSSLLSEDNNVFLDKSVYVESIVELGEEPVYDLTVEDNHNFYIITKTDDDNYLNCSGVLVHNCGEIPLCPRDSCRLLLLNLYSYVENSFSKDAKFNFNLFKLHTEKAQRLMDDIVDLEIEKVNKIIDKIEKSNEPNDIKYVELQLWEGVREKAIQGRRTGLGITGEGDMLAALGYTYGTKEATEFATEVHKQMAISSYESSINLAIERGPFYIWSENKESDSGFIKRILPLLSKQKQKEYEAFGRRNIANLTISPAGSVSLITQTTSGIEPAFQVAYKRRRKTDRKEFAVFTDEVGDMWEEYNVFHHKFVDWYRSSVNVLPETPFQTTLNELNEYSDEYIQFLIEKSPYYNATSADVDWKEKVRMQGSIQKFIDHSISVTVNVPENTDIQTVDSIYMQAYESGCKGVTIYREGSRSGVLISKETKQVEVSQYTDAIKRPKDLMCDVYHKQVLKKRKVILVGIHNNRPYEIFAFNDMEAIPDTVKRGRIVKNKRRNYTFISSCGKYKIDNIIDRLNETEQNETRMISTMLRHNINPKYIINQLESFATITSHHKAMERVLRNYVSNDDMSGEKCPECSNELVYEQGCKYCKNCGWGGCS